MWVRPRFADTGAAVDTGQSVDVALVARLRAGDERALEGIYERYGRAAYSLALRITRDPAVAEEVVQEVFLKVWRHPERYDPTRSPFSTWFLSVTHHRAIDEVRARRLVVPPSPERDKEMAVVIDDTVNLESLSWLREQRTTIRVALNDLPSAQRDAIELAYFGGLTQREISDRIGEPLGTVKTRMRLALRKLRGALESLAEPEISRMTSHGREPAAGQVSRSGNA
ncbi:MAG: sigma-70 family RNA polymerase sigma factor [Chloroflexota bacterium]|nr:MAG: sigma-70 family RNA polymerase sigma factor [Chloroflexota bacterium]